jgi:CubicO group peptidase (beta-lactamase class C family)
MNCLFSALILSTALMVPPVAARARTPVSTRIDRVAEFYHNRDGFSGIVAVARNHHTIFLRGYGYANFESKTAFAPTTRFRVGSLSKQFTAAALLLLQQDGKLKTSDFISRYEPNAPAAWSTITLRNLLTHTSGIPDVDFGFILKNSAHTPEQLIGETREKPLEFPPGSRMEYANINYMLLGRVIERASGQPYCQFLQERIFLPLRLTETGCDWNSLPASQRANGYRPSANGPVRVGDNDLSSIAGAGNLYSSAGDLIRWTEALFGGKVLSPGSLKEMTAPFMEGYGYGLQIDRQYGTIDISHNGAVDGFFSFLDYIPSKKVTVVVLTNLVGEGNHTTPGALALDTEVVRLTTDDTAVLPSEGREANVSEKLLGSYSGRYRAADPQSSQILIVTLADGHLYIQNEGTKNDPERMMAETPARFYLANQDIEVTFDLRGSGSLQVFDFSNMWGGDFERVTESTVKVPNYTDGVDARPVHQQP